MLFGAALLFAALLLSLYLVFQMYGLGRVVVEAEVPPSAACSPPGASRQVAVLRGEYSARFFGMAPSYDAHADYWLKLLENAKVACGRISDSELEGDLKRYSVLVLPCAVCLSEKEKSNVRAFVNGGGGVICTWAVGARDESGNWKGLDFLQELTGADSFEFSERPSPWLISFLNGEPTTAGLPGGRRIQVTSPERMEATAPNVDGYWCDARMLPVDPLRPTNFLGAVIHHQLGHGRVVWYGFQENSAVGGGIDKEVVDASLRNGLAWAGKRALSVLEPWPAPYSSAVMLALNLDEDYENAAYAANILLKGGVKGSFYCIPDTVKANPELMATLHRAGEVGLREDPRRPISYLWRLPALLQLESSRYAIWRLAGAWPSGWSAAYEVRSPQSLRALAGASIREVLVEGGGNSVLPEVHRVANSWLRFYRTADLVTLQRVTDDDLHLSPLGIQGLDPKWIVQRLGIDFENVVALGGLYVLVYHTQGLSSPEYVEALAKLIEQFRGRAVWVATGQEVADWWVMRNRLTVSVTSQNENSLRLVVGSKAARPLEGLILSVFPPIEATRALAVPLSGSHAPLQAIPDPARGRVQVRLGRLDPGETCTFELNLKP